MSIQGTLRLPVARSTRCFLESLLLTPFVQGVKGLFIHSITILQAGIVEDEKVAPPGKLWSLLWLRSSPLCPPVQPRRVRLFSNTPGLTCR